MIYIKTQIRHNYSAHNYSAHNTTRSTNRMAFARTIARSWATFNRIFAAKLSCNCRNWVNTGAVGVRPLGQGQTIATETVSGIAAAHTGVSTGESQLVGDS